MYQPNQPYECADCSNSLGYSPLSAPSDLGYDPLGSVSQTPVEYLAQTDETYAGLENVLGQEISQSISNLSEYQPTMEPMSWKDAKYGFQAGYILGMAIENQESTVYHLAGDLGYDRSELDQKVSEFEIRDAISSIGDIPVDPREVDVASAVFSDPIAKRTFREALESGNPDLSIATKRFQMTYTSHVVNFMGVEIAAKILEVSERTVRTHVKKYGDDQRNNYTFPDDCIVSPLLLEDQTTNQMNDQELNQLVQEFFSKADLHPAEKQIL